MAGILQKLRVITLGSIHDLLDAKIDLNSPSALRQYTRDVEDALTKMTNEACVQAGSVRTLQRECGDLQHQIDLATINLKKLVEGGAAEVVTRAKASELLRSKNQIDMDKADLVEQMSVSDKLNDAVTLLQSKHNELLSQVRRLERTDRQTKAMEQSASAFQDADKLLNTGVDVDAVSDKMRARNDVAQEKFNRALGAAQGQAEDPAHSADIDALLESLKPAAVAAAK